MSGPEWSGSLAGRRSILDAVYRLGLQIPTAAAPHQIDGLLSIDHGVPVTNFVHSTRLYNITMRHNKGLDRDHDGIACERH